MRIKWQLIPVVIILLILLSWVAVEGFGVITFDDIVAGLQTMNRPSAIGVIIFLLIIDVFIPIPSTPIIALSGTILGFWGGVLISVVGSMASSLLAYGLGKYGRRKLIARFVTQDELYSLRERIFIFAATGRRKNESFHP